MKKTVLLLALMIAFTPFSSLYASDGVGNSDDFMQSLNGRIQSVVAMPEGESRAANIVLLISDIMGFAAEQSAGIGPQMSGSHSQTYANAAAAYTRYRSWTHPAVAGEVSSLRRSLGEFQTVVKDLSSASGTLQSSVGGLAAALAQKGELIKTSYASRPLGPLATSVVDWTNATVTSLKNMADLQSAYSAKLLSFISAIDGNRDPGSLATELAQLESQIQNFQPVSGYSYAQIAQVFKTNSAQIRSQYPGLN